MLVIHVGLYYLVSRIVGAFLIGWMGHQHDGGTDEDAGQAFFMSLIPVLGDVFYLYILNRMAEVAWVSIFKNGFFSSVGGILKSFSWLESNKNQDDEAE